MTLRDVTEADNQYGSENFSCNSFQSYVFNKEFQEQVVQEYGSQHSNPIPEQLYAAFHFRGGEGYIFCQHKSGAECDREYNEKSSYMRAYGYYAQINNLTCQHELVKDVIQKNVEKGIGASGYAIPENLNRYELQEWKMKSINDANNREPANM